MDRDSGEMLVFIRQGQGQQCNVSVPQTTSDRDSGELFVFHRQHWTGTVVKC